MTTIPTNSLFYPGNVARVFCTFVNSGGALVDPSSVSAAWNYGGSSTSLDVSSIINPSVGLYYFDLHVNSPGSHLTRFTGHGNAKAQVFGAVHVASEAF